MTNPYLSKKIIPIQREPLALPFNPGRYEQYLWLDIREIEEEFNQRIKDFESDPMHKHHDHALMCVPQAAGSVFGVTTEMLLKNILLDLFENDGLTELSGVDNELSHYFGTDPLDPDYEYWIEVTAQFFSMARSMCQMLVEKFFTLLGENNFRKACKSDVYWHFLGIYNKQVLLGFGLGNYH